MEAIIGAVISKSTAKLTITGSTKIMSGDYGGPAVTRSGVGRIEFLGSSSVYTWNSSYDAIRTSVAGCTVRFETTGYLYTTGTRVLRAGSDGSLSLSLNVVSGHFACKSKYMFRYGGKNNKNHVSTDTSTVSRTFWYMTAYNTATSQSLSGFYHYTTGI
jgi:hypothetical protein